MCCTFLGKGPSCIVVHVRSCACTSVHVCASVCISSVSRNMFCGQTLRYPPCYWPRNHCNHKLVAAKAQPGHDHGTGRPIVAREAQPRWVWGNGHRSSWLRAVGHDPSANHGIMAQPAQPAKLDHVIRGQQNWVMFRKRHIYSHRPDAAPSPDEEERRGKMRKRQRC